MTRPCSTKVFHIPPSHSPNKSSAPNFILVVEKDTIFSAIVNSGFHVSEHCVVVCGCGVPCLGTRAFLSLLANEWPEVPILGIFDYNPYGIGICLTYAHGSSQGEPEAFRYTVPQMRLLGMRSRDIVELGHLLVPNRMKLNAKDRVKCESLRIIFSISTLCLDLEQEVRTSLESLRQLYSLLTSFTDKYLA